MRISSFVLCMVISACAFGQGTEKLMEFRKAVLGQYNYRYTRSNCKDYFELAASLIDLKNPDSARKATRIMWGLYLFDTLSYSYESFAPLLDKVKRSNQDYYETSLFGQWRFSHDFGTGLVTQLITTTSRDTGNLVKFDGQHAWFYFNDTLLRSTDYKLESKTTGFEFDRVNSFSIHFSDNNEYWSFALKKGYEGASMGMIVYLDPHCACGCKENIYRKISNSVDH